MFTVRVISAGVAFCVVLFGLSICRRHLKKSRYPYHARTDANPAPPYGRNAAFANTARNRKPSVATVELNGERVKLEDGTELVYQQPSGRTAGTVLFLHGCSHSATDFFPSSERCSQCIGLPEEVKMTRIALQKGYSVVAVSSTNRKHKCWKTNPDLKGEPDYQRVRSALHEIESRGAHSSSIPLFAVGISSGGMFATSLPLFFNVAGVNSIVSASICSHGHCNNTSPSSVRPPHVFTHMNVRDKPTAQRVESAMKKLEVLGTNVKQFTVQPQRVTEQYLMNAVPDWDLSLTEKVVQALRRCNMIDEHGKLLANPRRFLWRGAVNPIKNELGDSLIADESALSEVLNTAWAAHEITAEFFDRTLTFLADNHK